MRAVFFLWAALGLLAPASAAPKLLVVVSVDQMRADYLDRYAPDYRGGFKELGENGAVLTEAVQAHVPTETCPGHAVILTGRSPERTGIVANHWWDRDLSTSVYCVADSVFGLGPEHLQAYTLGDALKAKNPASRVVAISIKDRAAILLGGKRPDGALWYDRRTGDFTTSSYYVRPAWLDAFNARQKAAGGLLADSTTDYYSEVVFDPKADRLLLGLAEEALKQERLGQGDAPDILAISFSATDFIGHRYGAFSSRMRDQLLSLDMILGRLLADLDAQVGRDRFDLVLTADHGGIPPPELPEGRAVHSKRLLASEFSARLEKAMQDAFPAGGAPWLLEYEFPNVYLDRALAEKQRHDWPSFLKLSAKALKAVPDVAAVYIPGDLDSMDPYAEVYRRSVSPGRSGDLLLRLDSGVYTTDPDYRGDHGSPYAYDARVPLVFFGPDFKKGRYKEPARITDLAPTCAALLGVDLAPEEGSKVRSEVFQETTR